ncbi:MAG: SIS domain-containing protein [Anaerolineae bacterium]|nr:SIS domain-containing protein [Anaerolineae bacterium]
MQAEPLTLGHVREQPPFIEAALAAALPRLPDLIARLRAQPPRHIWVTGCASSLFATMCGASIVQEFARRPVTVMHASEFAAYAPVDAGDWVLIGSRSGETGDVIDAIDAIKQAGATLVGIAGDATSTLATEATVAPPVRLRRGGCAGDQELPDRGGPVDAGWPGRGARRRWRLY